MSDNPLLNRPSNPNLDITIGKEKHRPSSDPALIDHDEVPSLWSMLSRLFRRKPKLSMSFRESLGPHIVIEAEYEGKRYQGVLYPIEEESNA